jgi:hypothetical protein
MMRFAVRRTRNLIIAALAAIGLIVWLGLQDVSLQRSAYTSGWLLIGMCFFLAAYNLRKKLPFIPLGASSSWLQFHIYVGLLSIVVFIGHAVYKPDAGFSWPNGYLEFTLGLLYALVAASGVFGLFITRFIPARLTVRGEEVIFERIGSFRRRVRDEAAALVVQSVAEADVTTIADYYTHRLAVFFERPRNFWRHLIQSAGPRHEYLRELSDLDRYLSDVERPIAAKLTTLVEVKDDLDYQHALQFTLKTWLFAHIGLTYAMLLLAAMHAVLAYAFAGGVA